MKQLQWHEPAAYRRAIFYSNERKDPASSLKYAGLVFLVMAGLRLIVPNTPDSHPPPWAASLAVAAGVALIAAYGMPALMSILPGSIVILSEKGVNNNVVTGRGVGIRFWPWERIAFCSASADTVGGRTYELLSFYGPDRELLWTAALAGRPPMWEIEQYLLQYGKRLEKNA
jgi:hypothetical protein